jgi:hypothetical protein
VALASLGARQSPRGDSEPPEPIFGELGTQDRLNWLVVKKRCKKVRRCLLISAKEYLSCHAWCARKATFDGENP